MQLEHANLTVSDLDATTAFLTAAFPSATVRGAGTDTNGRQWRHVGDHDAYVALMLAADDGAIRTPYSPTAGFNHLGWVVDDIEALESRLREIGCQPNLRDDSHPARRRLYFYDPDGNDWEFVQYLTDDPTRRHAY